MNPSDGGGVGWFDWTAGVLVPLIGVAASIGVPLLVLYRQRRHDERRLQDERGRSDARLREQRAIAEADRLSEARKRATRDAVSALAPFIGLNPFTVEVHPLLVSLRVSLMSLVDEYPADHPINDLVSNHQHLGMAIANAILEAGEPVPRPSVSQSEALRRLEELINPLHGWAAHFTSDLRVVQADGATDEQIVAASEAVRNELESLFSRNGWGEPPSQTLRRRPRRDEAPEA